METSSSPCCGVEAENVCDDGCSCCNCNECSAKYCGSNCEGAAPFTSQLAVFKEVWEQWSELQQVLALYSILRHSSSQHTTAHLMIANMLYAHHNPDYIQHVFQQANDPVWVASMEVKCVEEGTMELQAEDGDEDRRESFLSQDRVVSEVDADRREGGASAERRESGSSGERRVSASSCDRRDSGEVWEDQKDKSNKILSEKSLYEDKREADLNSDKSSIKSQRVLSGNVALCDKCDNGVCDGRLDGTSVRRCSCTSDGRRGSRGDTVLRRDSAERRESEVSVEKRELGGAEDRRESCTSGTSFCDRRDSRDNSADKRERSNSSTHCSKDGKGYRSDYDNEEDLGDNEDKAAPAAAEAPFLDTINELLVHLPLLHTNNADTKNVYLAVISKVVCISIRLSNASCQSEVTSSVSLRTRQLVTYAMLHPCVTQGERKGLMACLHSLDSGDTTDTSYADPHKWSDLEGGGSAGDDLLCSSGAKAGEDPTSTGGKGDPVMAGATPIRDVCTWLKSLRLHKYDWLVRGMQYRQLVALDDETLEARGVTKGARHKLLLSVARLAQRHLHLLAIEKELQRGGYATVEAAIAQLRALIITPMPPPSGDAPTDAAAQHADSGDVVPPPPHSDALQSDPPHDDVPQASSGEAAGNPEASAVDATSAQTRAQFQPPEAAPQYSVQFAREHQAADTEQEKEDITAARANTLVHDDAAAGAVECDAELRDRKADASTDSAATIADDDNIPASFTRVLGKVVSAVAMGCGLHHSVSTSAQLLPGCSTSLVVNLLWVLDKCLQHESFAAHHRRLWLWRSQLVLPSDMQLGGYPVGGVARQRNRRWSHQLEFQLPMHQMQPPLLQQYPAHIPQTFIPGMPPLNILGCFSPGGRLYRGAPPPGPPPHMLANPTLLPSPHLLPAPHPALWGGRPGYGGGAPGVVAPSAALGLTVPASSLLSPQPFLAKRPSLQEPPCQLRPHVSLQRTRSAPSRPHPPHVSGRHPSPGHTPPHTSPLRRSSVAAPTAPQQDDDITSRLESLCLSVTQHALE